MCGLTAELLGACHRSEVLVLIGKGGIFAPFNAWLAFVVEFFAPQLEQVFPASLSCFASGKDSADGGATHLSPGFILSQLT